MDLRFPEPGVQGGPRRGMRPDKRGISGDGSEPERPELERGRFRDHRIGESVWRGAELSVLRIDVAVAIAICLTYGVQQSTFYPDRRASSAERAGARR